MLLFRSFRDKRVGRAPGKQRFVPRLEALEDRLVPAATVFTDYTQIAQMFPRHTGPTTLAINFDGWKDNVSYWGLGEDDSVSPFQSPTGNRDRDIQDILFRVSEFFAPFDVRVVQLNGDGNHYTDGGDTTIFVGPNAQHHSFTPADFADMPGSNRGYTHRPNSDGYDVGYVDPTLLSNLEIAQAIAHEAGHTFGLGHVRTDSEKDPTPLGPGYVGDIMSYTSNGTGFEHFVDQTLTLTAYNFDGGSTSLENDVLPGWYVPTGLSYPYPPYVGYRLQTQNSYQFLQAALGSRPGDDFANVANATSVEYYTAPTALRPHVITFRDGSSVYEASVVGKLERTGDYDVFSFTCARSGQVTIQGFGNLYGYSIPGYNPELFVYDPSNGVLKAYSAAQNPMLSLNMNKGDTVSIVVGGHDGWIGDYSLYVRAPMPFYAGLVATHVGALMGSPGLPPGDVQVAGTLLAAVSTTSVTPRPIDAAAALTTSLSPGRLGPVRTGAFDVAVPPSRGIGRLDAQRLAAAHLPPTGSLELMDLVFSRI